MKQLYTLKQKKQSRRIIACYLLYTFCLTWLCWAIIIIANKYFNTLLYGQPLFWIPYTIGSLGPAISAYIVFRKFKKNFTEQTFIEYIFVKKISKEAWILFALFLVWRFFMIWFSFGINKPISILSFLINLPFLIVLGGMEELGWRGIFQPKLEKLTTFIISIIIVAIIWSIWHIPLWFIKGSTQSAFPFWLYFTSGLVLTASFTTFYKYTHNLFLSVMSHAWFNSCIGLALYVGNNGILQLNLNGKVILVFSIELIAAIILGGIYNRNKPREI